MALIVDKAIKIFDISAIQRGNCIRIRRTGDTIFKNGFVIQVSESQMQILYCNTQNNATSYLTILAADVAVGVWEIYWTLDFQSINYENNISVDGG